MTATKVRKGKPTAPAPGSKDSAPAVGFGRTELLRLRIRDMKPHPDAQRSITPQKLRRKEPFVPELCLPHLAGPDPVDGLYLIIDAQHRWFKLRHELKWPDYEVNCIYYPEVRTIEVASLLYLILNNQSQARPIERHKAQVLARNADASRIEVVLKEFDLQSAAGKSPNSVCCIGSLYKAVALKQGPEPLRAALGTAISTWGRTADSYNGDILLGLARFFASHDGKGVDRASLPKRLLRRYAEPINLLVMARQNKRAKSVSESVAALVLEEYNAGRRSGRL